MFAPWPMPLDDDFKGHYGLDDCYLKIAGTKYELVSQGRNLRREANISAAKKIRYVLKPVNHLPPHDIEVIRLLLNAEAVEVNENYQPPKGTLTARTELGELFLPLEGLRSAEELAAEKVARSPRNSKKSKPKFPKSSRSWPIRTSRKKFRRRFCRSISSASPNGRPSARTSRPRSTRWVDFQPRNTRTTQKFSRKSCFRVIRVFRGLFCVASFNFRSHGARTRHRHRHLHHRRVDRGGGVAGRAPAAAARVSRRGLRHRAAWLQVHHRTRATSRPFRKSACRCCCS